MSSGSMTKGVGLYQKLVAKSSASVPLLLQKIREHCAESTSNPPKRTTLVSVDRDVVLVEEWDSEANYDQYNANVSPWSNSLNDDIIASETREYFPEALHISNPIDANIETVGILVRQKTASKENGAQLRDAQREAYERQMTMEPGCTGCIILAGSERDKSQVRIIELWKTMDDFHFHETSEWHAKGEEKVVPLVIDMDCDFVKGWQLIQDY